MMMKFYDGTACNDMKLCFSFSNSDFSNSEGGGFGARILSQHAGGTLLLTYADKRGGGGAKIRKSC